jgi:hypothetical protein
MDRGIERHKSPDRPPGARLGGFFLSSAHRAALLCHSPPWRAWVVLADRVAYACLPAAACTPYGTRPPAVLRLRCGNDTATSPARPPAPGAHPIGGTRRWVVHCACVNLRHIGWRLRSRTGLDVKMPCFGSERREELVLLYVTQGFPSSCRVEDHRVGLVGWPNGRDSPNTPR